MADLERRPALSVAVSADLAEEPDPRIPTDSKEAIGFHKSIIGSIRDSVRVIRGLNRDRRIGDRIVEFKTGPSGRLTKTAFPKSRR